MKIVMVQPFWAHYRQELVRELEQRAPIDFEWWGDEADYKPSGIPVAPLDFVRVRRVFKNRALPGGLLWQRGLLTDALRSDAQAIVLSGDVHHLSTWLAAPLMRARGKRVLFWTHGWRRRETGPKGWVRLAFYRMANELLLYGPDGQSLAVEAGLKAENLHVIYNSVGRRHMPPVPNRPKGDEQSWLVVSRLIPGRRIEEAINQVGRLNHEGKKVTLRVVGEGPERPRLEQLARTLDASVIFLGAVYEEEVLGTLFAEADICLSPGNVGLTAINALAHGCPVATHADAHHQFPEHCAVIDGVTGVRFPRDEFGAMADASWNFVSTTDRASVASACREEYERNWTPERQAQLFIHAFMFRSSGDTASENKE